MYISSDTNIWIDFYEIGHLDHPFRLTHEYYISKEAYNDELLKSDELRQELINKGLKLAEVNEDEFSQARAYSEMYRRLSIYDTIALSIAKSRKWILLTGDKRLREAAEKESVECHGIIWIYDELKDDGMMTNKEYHSAIADLTEAVENGLCRLPKDELEKRQGNGERAIHNTGLSALKHAEMPDLNDTLEGR